MAKKMDEKELNNVSGGCGDKTEIWDYKLTCFDYNNNQVGPTSYYLPNSSSETEVKKVIKDECIRIFNDDKNIYKIEYVTIKDEIGKTLGTVYRK